MEILIVSDDASKRSHLTQVVELAASPVSSVSSTGLHEAAACLRGAVPHGLVVEMDRICDQKMVLLRLASELFIPVVIVTVTVAYFVDAFELGVTDCILWPFVPDRMLSALFKIRRLRSRPVPEGLMFLSDSQCIWPVKLNEVVAVVGDGGYSVVHLRDSSSITLSRNLREIEADFEDKGFVRVNRGTILNLRNVKVFKRLSTGGLRAEIEGMEAVEFSRRQAQVFRRRFLA